MPPMAQRLIALTAAVSLLLVAAPAHAGGLFLPGHGVRGLARGGAFVAGADDPGGIWYNPATLDAVTGHHLLVDASVVRMSLDYTRVDSGGNVYDPVSSENPFVPIPTLAYGTHVIKDRLAVGVAVSAPYGAVPRYPYPNYGPCDPAAPRECIDTAAQDAPQRYSLITMEHSKFIRLDLAVAWRVVDQLTIGVALQNMFVVFDSISAISSYNGFSSGPEDPEFDSLARLKMVDMFNPSANVGVVVRPTADITLGFSVQLPFWIGGEAETTVQLPVNPLYTKSSVEGSAAELEFKLPLTLRLGVEIRMIPQLRLELGLDWQRWSELPELRIVPQDIYILNIPGIDRYKIQQMVIDLQLSDTFAVRLGGEYFFEAIELVLRAGYCFERGAVKDEYSAVVAVDPNKHALSVGAGYTVGGYRIDVVYAHYIFHSTTVDFRQSKSMQVNPVNPTGAVAVGGGSYVGFAQTFGLGVSKSF